MKTGSYPYIWRTPRGYCASSTLRACWSFGKLALFVDERLAQFGNALFLLADLLEDDLDGSFLDPRLAARGSLLVRVLLSAGS